MHGISKLRLDSLQVLSLGKKRIYYTIRRKKVMINYLKPFPIFKVLKFVQQPVMKKYISENAMQRKKAKTKQQKTYYKNLNNMVFGKTLMNKRKHSDNVFVTSVSEFKREVSKTKFKRYVAFGEECGLVYHHKTSFSADQFVYLGAAILSISKLIMLKS